MESPLSTYNYFVKKYGYLGAQKRVYELFDKKYFRPFPVNDTQVILRKFGFFVPGRIYTYTYDPKYKNILDWYDTKPLILSLKHWKSETTGNYIETGINLNFIPPTMRIQLLEILFKTYKNIININQKNEKDGKLNKQKPLFIETYDYMSVLDYIFDSVAQTSYKFAIRNYIKTRMYFGRIIEYNDFGKCSLIQTKNMCGATLDEVHKKYWEYKLNKQKQHVKLDEKTKTKFKQHIKKRIPIKKKK